MGSFPLLPYAAAVSLAFLVLRIIYRLFFHPLAKFPGPKLAAVTTLYNAYYDILDSGLVKCLPELHEKYGPIVRIQPDEIHVADLEGYNQIFKVGTPFDRVWHDNPFLTGSLQSLTTLTETRKRKEFLAPFFSKAAILRVEPYLHRQKLTQFLSTLLPAAQANQGRGSVLDFFLAFRCLTADTIMDYCFQQDLGALSEPGFRSERVEQFVKGFDMALISTYFPTVFGLLNRLIFSLPEWVRERYFAPVYGFQCMQKLAQERVEYLMANPDSTNSKIPTMFDLMLAPDKEKGQTTPSKRDMIADGCLMIAAGTDTTANILGLVLWHITQNPEVEQKLVEELKEGIRDREEVVSSATLEGDKFKYLQACVKEALRLGLGVPGRLIRRVPKEGVTISGRYVPGGIRITSSIYMQNTDANTFPDPFKYDPERWMCDPDTYKQRERQMLSFSRGSRSCIGINLAYAELHLTTAHLFRRFEISTTGYTSEWDMDWNDRFVPVPNGRIKGLIRVREE
ncbi:cytochrome P450 [Lindgomyces ingoldianus]|uniref:Cytochrome P450 n=1 Tax=Lindgomyces ingoldianus TaxID=673940 RepID=A0ACB6QR42_9PLEO|nr:cytochrome P450 [Lindgomyces ingoldianus]KAF2468547.1 cytochrome P450 [Lindgomyces ingoldianus]